jgi:hypothetical protein
VPVLYNGGMNQNNSFHDENDEPLFENRIARRSIPEDLYYGYGKKETPSRSSRVRRFLYLLFILLTLLAFLAYELYFLLQGYQPPPTPAPTSLPLHLI